MRNPVSAAVAARSQTSVTVKGPESRAITPQATLTKKTSWPRLILRHEFGRGASSRLRLKIDVSHREIVAVPYDKAGVIGFIERPWWWEAARGHEGDLWGQLGRHS